MSTPEYLTTSQVARRLGVNEKTVRRRIERGEIPATKGMLPTGTEGWQISPSWAQENAPDTLPDGAPGVSGATPDTTPDREGNKPDTPDIQGETTLIRASDTLPDVSDTMPDSRALGRIEGWMAHELDDHLNGVMEKHLKPLHERIEATEKDRVGQTEKVVSDQLERLLTPVVETIETMAAQQEKLAEENRRLQRELDEAKAEQSKSWWEKMRGRK